MYFFPFARAPRFRGCLLPEGTAGLLPARPPAREPCFLVNLASVTQSSLLFLFTELFPLRVSGPISTAGPTSLGPLASSLRFTPCKGTLFALPRRAREGEGRREAGVHAAFHLQPGGPGAALPFM